ncbi:hypothetical protein [Saccharopolyspora hattusasensis]|uniref:hypothetical protein n=1 Tax=Saccharopolyspora hattusasensis TaxID=1128679 RepID=UPI003D977FC1
MTNDEHEPDSQTDSTDELRVAAKKAVSQVRIAENTACYWDGHNGTRQADGAHNAALKAIDDLADAVM